MKNDKELKKLFKGARGDNEYYNFEQFKDDARGFLSEVRKMKLVMSMTVSRSGMTRHFNSIGSNMVMNICHNNKFSWDSVKVGGCGMDMHWHLIFRVCEDLSTEKENEKYNYNNLASSQPLL